MGQIAGTTFGYGAPLGSFAQQSPWGASPVQQTLQSLQFIPQQLQQLQALQQQQLLYIQQLLQIVPAQLQQLQQVVQIAAAHQAPYLQQQLQPFGQAIQGSLGFGLAAPPFGGQSAAHVM